MVKLFSFNKKVFWVTLLLVAVFAPKLLMFFFIGALILSLLPALAGIIGLWYVRTKVRRAAGENNFSNVNKEEVNSSARQKYNSNSFSSADNESKNQGTVIDCDDFSVVDDDEK